MQVIAALRQTSASQLESRVLAQIVQIVGIGTAAGNHAFRSRHVNVPKRGDSENPATQNVGHCMADQGLVVVFPWRLQFTVTGSTKGETAR